MSNDVTFKIWVSTDEEGFVYLRCPDCGEKFMLQKKDLEDESTIDVWCPSCGLIHDSYINDEVRAVQEDLIKTYIEDTFKNSKESKNNKVKVIEKNLEFQVGINTGDYKEFKFLCCSKIAKVNSLKLVEGMYCPFCGEMSDGN